MTTYTITIQRTMIAVNQARFDLVAESTEAAIATAKGMLKSWGWDTLAHAPPVKEDSSMPLTTYDVSAVESE